MTKTPEYTLIQASNEWSALYEDGKLLTYGDHDYVHETLFGALGVELEYNNDWIKDGFSGNPTIAQTLEQVEQFRQEKIDAAQKITELEAEIARLKNL